MAGDKNGVITLRANTEAGRKVQQRLSDEQTLVAMDRLLSRMDTLEQAVTRLSVVMEQGPGMVAMAGDMLDEA